MSRTATAATESLPPAARAIALLLASTPTVQDAQPGVLHQLLEFSHRYTAQVLSDALVYAEHAGWEFGGRVPKEYTLSLATQTNAQPLPVVPEVFGLRLPPANECLTAIDFDLVPNRPPPEEKQYDEEIEEIVESASEDDEEDMEPAAIPDAAAAARAPAQSQAASAAAHRPAVVTDPVNAARTPSDDRKVATRTDGLFAGGEESGGDEPMEEVTTTAEDHADGLKRKLVEEDDYD
ncbi:transcription initiation factor IID, 31kD subunit-domain-containing protein [Russula earlei]|uniref:Transcription initiation factor IID, 31kD subunit-domain-containing protein n=1 Tax=Russula earlei TaxID=71964 RepID=A0ACC0TZB0_9AGAM|nr:transcription initiation factor IID, 31kD subunit-domain-containing protein [Russula earlei]